MSDDPGHPSAVEDAVQLLAAERVARARAEAAAQLLVRLQAITTAFAAAVTHEEVSDIVVAEALTATEASAGALFLLDDERRTMGAERTIGYPAEVVDLYRQFPLDADLPAAEAVRTGKPVFIADIASANAHVRSIAVRGGRRSVAALPLLIGRRPVGTLLLSFHDVQAFDTIQREYLVAVANQCATALERTRLYEAEQARRREAEAAQHRLGFLAEATRALASSLDRQEVLRRLSRLSVAHLCELIAVWLPADGRLERVSFAHADLASEEVLRPVAREVSVAIGSDSPLAVCFSTGHEQSIAMDRILRRRSGFPPELVDDPRFRVHTSLLVPITARGRVLGVMVFGLIDPERSFADADVAVALELGARAGTSMENAELFERERSMAEILQTAILPQTLPTVGGFELAARYLPATSGLQVGGDWYDAFVLRDGRVGIAVGDVAGHGIRAAATMGQLRNGLRAYAIGGDRPSTVLAHLNQLLSETEPDTLATLVYGLLDPATGVLEWCCAGHPPPVIGRDTDATFLPADVGLVLGVDRDAAFVDSQAVIEPGSALVLFTDGLVERRGEHLEAGLERLRFTVGRQPPTGVEDVCRRVVTDMVGAGWRDDDVCLLALWRQPEH